MIYYLKCPYCGEEAFHFKYKPYKDMVIGSDSVNGCVSHAIIKCTICKHIIYNKDLVKKNLREKDE